MPFVNRSTLPADFMDITASEMLWQPRPEYIYAQLFKMALNASMGEGEGGMASPGRSAIGASGATVPSGESMALNLSDPVYSSAIRVVPELGRAPGHTVKLNRPVFTATTYTEASREIASGSTISTTPIALDMEQATVTLKRWGGPYSSTQSAVAPIGIERFDARLAIHSTAQYAKEILVDDFDRFTHTVLNTLLESASTTVRPSNFTADAQFVTQDAARFDLETALKVEHQLRSTNIRPFPNGRWALVLDPKQTRDLALDPLFAKYAEAHPPVNPVLSMSYFKTVGSLDIFRSNLLTTDTSTVAGVTIYHGQAFGPAVLGAGIGRLPEVVPSNNDNFGEHVLLAWLMYAGWALLDNRFAVSVRTT